MMATKPTIYILAGANGVGKTTVNPFFIPKNVPYVNADDFAYQLRQRLGNDVNVQELANAEALEQMNRFIAKRRTFAIETNLADTDTWLFLIGIQGLGYDVHLNFFGVSDVDICINRVNNRVLQGGHYVRPDIVIARYKTGLALLKHYKNIPNGSF
jgi:predicted ABC-type ATPase